MAQAIVGDAKVSLMELSQALGNWKADDNWYQKSRVELKNWETYVEKESGPTNQKLPSYAQVIGACYRNSDPSDIACLLYTSPSPRDLSTSRMPSSA